MVQSKDGRRCVAGSFLDYTLLDCGNLGPLRGDNDVCCRPYYLFTRLYFIVTRKCVINSKCSKIVQREYHNVPGRP